MAEDLEARLAAYANYFRTLTPESVPRLGQLVAPDVHFRDPFNDLRGAQRMQRALATMFADATEVGFEVLDQVLNGEVGYLRWRFRFKPKRLRLSAPWSIDGMSEVRFAPDGRVAEHLDHWDAASQFYARLPVLGAVIRWVARRLKVD
jgi:steroid delta-isomerase